MLDEKELRLAERRIAWEQRDWFTRVGLDWVGVATGLAMTFVALQQAGWTGDVVVWASGGGFVLGGSIAQLFRARESRLLAKLYRTAKERGAP